MHRGCTHRSAHGFWNSPCVLFERRCKWKPLRPLRARFCDGPDTTVWRVMFILRVPCYATLCYVALRHAMLRYDMVWCVCVCGDALEGPVEKNGEERNTCISIVKCVPSGIITCVLTNGSRTKSPSIKNLRVLVLKRKHDARARMASLSLEVSRFRFPAAVRFESWA